MKYFEPCKKEYNFMRHLALLYQGNTGIDWTPGEFKIHLVRMDSADTEVSWLYDSLLFFPLNSGRKRTLLADVNAGTTRCGEGNFHAVPVPNPMEKSDWEDIIGFYFDKGRNLDNLNHTAGVLKNKKLPGAIREKVNVILTIPYPSIKQERFGDNLDFTTVKQNLERATAQRIEAVRWFVNECVTRWNDKKYVNINLLGFYWPFETVFRSWDIDDHVLLKTVKPVINSSGHKLFWIPYFCSYNEHVLDDYENYYFDCAFYQPNFLFYKRYTGIEHAAMAAKKRHAGIEIEYALSDHESVGRAELRRMRFREYLNCGVKYGYMTESIIAWYLSRDGFIRTRAAVAAEDRAVYDDICDFVQGKYVIKNNV
ncbi:MAG: DUF4855 domain-containing protein [Elusimicrobiota bacterium]